MPTAHIYTFSRLVHAYPGNWEKLLASMESEKQIAYGYYLPMREAVVLFCARRGKDRDLIFRQMVSRARNMGGMRGPKMAEDNAEAFIGFETAFYPKIAKFRRDLLREQRTGCEFEGLTLEGGPHFEAVDQRGKKRHVFLHASKWSHDDLAAYLELLGIVIEHEYGGDSSSLWVFDLKSGKEIKWRSSSRVRNRCVGAARLYARLIRAMENPEDI
jgi:hypothetical protein